jgi:hypothetical protein
MSELFDKRVKFTSLMARLIRYMIEQGYTPLHGKDGLKHMSKSLHYEGLAVDIDLFKDGVYLTSTEDHRQFGEFWESLDEDCRWGGRFKGNPDGNHYAITYQGRS